MWHTYMHTNTYTMILIYLSLSPIHTVPQALLLLQMYRELPPMLVYRDRVTLLTLNIHQYQDIEILKGLSYNNTVYWSIRRPIQWPTYLNHHGLHLLKCVCCIIPFSQHTNYSKLTDSTCMALPWWRCIFPKGRSWWHGISMTVNGGYHRTIGSV